MSLDRYALVPSLAATQASASVRLGESGAPRAPATLQAGCTSQPKPPTPPERVQVHRGRYCEVQPPSAPRVDGTQHADDPQQPAATTGSVDGAATGNPPPARTGRGRAMNTEPVETGGRADGLLGASNAAVAALNGATIDQAARQGRARDPGIAALQRPRARGERGAPEAQRWRQGKDEKHLRFTGVGDVCHFGKRCSRACNDRRGARSTASLI